MQDGVPLTENLIFPPVYPISSLQHTIPPPPSEKQLEGKFSLHSSQAVCRLGSCSTSLRTETAFKPHGPTKKKKGARLRWILRGSETQALRNAVIRGHPHHFYHRLSSREAGPSEAAGWVIDPSSPWHQL